MMFAKSYKYKLSMSLSLKLNMIKSSQCKEQQIKNKFLMIRKSHYIELIF